MAIRSLVRFSRPSFKLVMRVVVQQQTPTPPYQLAWIAAALALAAVSSCFPCLSQLEEEEEEFRRQQQQQTEMYSNNNRQGREENKDGLPRTTRLSYGSVQPGCCIFRYAYYSLVKGVNIHKISSSSFFSNSLKD